MNPPRARIDATGVIALIAGATGIGLAPILVRLSEVGPVATAFYRLLLAQPIIWLLLKREKNNAKPIDASSPDEFRELTDNSEASKVGSVAPRAPRMQRVLSLNEKTKIAKTADSNSPSHRGEGRGEGPLALSNVSTSPVRSDLFLSALAGLFFTADLSIWHWSLRLTTVANSTFVTNLTPFFVTIAAWLLFRERVTSRLLIGMCIAFAGGTLMISDSFHLKPHFLVGDSLAMLAAIFYAGYLLVVKRLRRGRSTWYVMAWTGAFAAPTMLLVSIVTKEILLPKTPAGWSVVIALALVSQLGGQGMIAYGLAHLSASVSAILLMWQPVVAALLAWWILHEPLTPIRTLGGAIIIIGILVATWQTSNGPRKAGSSEPASARKS
jgi:drug/metabolite transporter (DMT)-like permease